MSIFQNTKSKVSEEKVGVSFISKVLVPHQNIAALETLRGKVEIYERRGEGNFC